MAPRIDAAATSIGPGRRALLRGLVAVGAASGLAAPHLARSAGTRTLKMGYVYVRDSQLGAGAAEFASRIEAATGGAYRIEQYPNGSLGGEVEMLGGLRRGEIDLGFISHDVFASLAPEFGVFTLPFLFRDASHAHAVLDSPIGQDYLGKWHGGAVMPLAWGEIGMRHITNSKHPIREPVDLRDLRLWVPQSAVSLRCFRQLGADAASLGFPAVYGALESGRFDGQENPIATIHAARLEWVQRYLTLSGHMYTGAIILISKDIWEDLSPAHREVFTEAAVAGGLASRQAAGVAEQKGVWALRAAGMEIVPEVDRAVFLAALEPTWSELARQFGEDRIAQMRAIAG